MRRALPIAARWLHTVSLSLWLGGLVAIGALVAPTAFHVVRINPGLAGNEALQTALAGGIVGGSLRTFNVLCYVCAVVLIGANVALLAGGPPGRAERLWTAAGIAVAIVLFGTALYLGFHLFPAIDQAQQQNNTPLFDQLHRRYERLSGAQLPLLLLLALLAALREAGAAGSVSEQQPSLRTDVPSQPRGG